MSEPMVTIPASKYHELLELVAEQTMKAKRLEETLKAEFNFAEEKVKENEALSKNVSLMGKFINSKKLSKEYQASFSLFFDLQKA